MKKQQTNWKVTLLMVFSSITIGVTVGEVGLRMANMDGVPKIQENMELSPTIFHTTDLDRGWALKPGAVAEWTNEGKSSIQINSQGLRDQEHSKEKPKNTLRIAVLGDSFTEAFHVPLEQTFWSLLTENLKQCDAVGGRTIEPINFGVHGYGTAQEFITLQKYAWDYSPDIVILAFFTGNDIINNSKALEYDHYRPFFVYQDGQLVPDMSFRDIPRGYSNRYGVTFIDYLPAWLVNNSRILKLIKKVELDHKKRQYSDDFTRLSAKNYIEPTDAAWKEAWHVTEGLIAAMHHEVTQKGSQFLLVTIGDPNQVSPNPTRRKNYMKENNIYNFFYPEERLQKLGEQQKFPVLTLAQPFQAYAETNQVCLHGFDNALPCLGHWNQQGHKLASRLISQKICEMLKSPKTHPQKP